VSDGTTAPVAEADRAEVHLQVDTDLRGVPAAAKLRDWAATAAGPQPGGEMTLRIVGEAESAELNRRYRDRDGPTNVLSFSPADDWPDLAGERKPVGDLVICAPVVDREAEEYGRPAEAHWAHIVIHGTLHLLGHDHEIDLDARAMESRERALLAGFGFPDPYADHD